MKVAPHAGSASDAAARYRTHRRLTRRIEHSRGHLDHHRGFGDRAKHEERDRASRHRARRRCFLRLLVFSNHVDALPLAETDRRFYVIENPSAPRDPVYYQRIYSLLKDPGFIESVRQYLRTFDLAGFDVGARPPMTDAKRVLLDSLKDEAAIDIEQALKDWPAWAVTSSDVRRAVRWEGDLRKTAKLFASFMQATGTRKYPLQTRVNGGKEAVWIVRDLDLHLGRPPHVVAAEALRGREVAVAAGLLPPSSDFTVEVAS